MQETSEKYLQYVQNLVSSQVCSLCDYEHISGQIVQKV